MISRHHPNRRAYNWLVYDINDRLLERCIPLFKGTLYDLGAGESPYKDFFLEHAETYVAVDWAASYHDTKPDLVADLNEPLPVADAVADTAVSLSVLAHLREPQLMLTEAHRILKPGGSLVLQVPWQWRIIEAPHDYFRFTPFGLQHLLSRAGFMDVLVEPHAGFFTTLIMKMNYFSLRMIRGPRPLRWALRNGLRIPWYVGQKLAPLLDKLDQDWRAEAPGYFVTARKAG